MWEAGVHRFTKRNVLSYFFAFTLGVVVTHIVQKRLVSLEPESEGGRREILYGSPLQYCPGGAHQHRAALVSVLKKERPGLILDVGAYDGRDAIAYARAGHKVLSFEPVPSKHAKIERNFRESGVWDQIELHKIALGNFTGETRFYVNKPLRAKDGWVDDNIGSEQDGIYVPWSGALATTVTVDTLDNIVGNRTVLHAKIDAQGHDAVVLEGAKHLLESGRMKTFSFEIAPKLTTDPASYVRILKWLNIHGYTCFDCTSFESVAKRGKTSNVHAMLIDEFIETLHKGVFKYRGADHGSQSEVVCMNTQSRNNL
mmetsp:Transcript_29562/g.49702  ORF Transcript_29562/g.49702 Transcript_29562/m.49702 type:complete len:313 (-) Transcript_29562:840-1778(-)|eukprot:CAMPEP_0198229930 /NCGR_PEP_ID=MMETSP1445-20131203/114378_1 /TAXON_ID=36898 /ORGANISM="Pyramimonas sp., Strain CCMP2087" /LENGTH=312 /DNA_ID=CAMNT_0043910413 /DNA_START=152 /DNA_END=1090 /DNA_ORIENTATION=-